MYDQQYPNWNLTHQSISKYVPETKWDDDDNYIYMSSTIAAGYGFIIQISGRRV